MKKLRKVGEQDLTQLAVMILCDNSTGCDGADDFFATEADTILDIVYENYLMMMMMRMMMMLWGRRVII